MGVLLFLKILIVIFSNGPNTELLNDFKKVFSKSMYEVIEQILELNPNERTINFF